MSDPTTTPTTTPTMHICDSGRYNRSFCPDPCGLVHAFCTVCGKRSEPCAHDTAPTPTEPHHDVRERVIDALFDTLAYSRWAEADRWTVGRAADAVLAAVSSAAPVADDEGGQER